MCVLFVPALRIRIFLVCCYSSDLVTCRFPLLVVAMLLVPREGSLFSSIPMVTMVAVSIIVLPVALLVALGVLTFTEAFSCSFLTVLALATALAVAEVSLLVQPHGAFQHMLVYSAERLAVWLKGWVILLGLLCELLAYQFIINHCDLGVVATLSGTFGHLEASLQK